MSEKEPILKPKEEIKETKEKEPEMRLRFFFLAHRDKRDFMSLRKEIEDCDVYIPEVSHYEPETLSDFRDISLGKLTPGELIQQDEARREHDEELSDYIKGLVECLYNSKKPIYFVDIPEGHELELELENAEKLSHRAGNDFLSGNYTRALVNQKKYIEAFIRGQRKREKYIEDNIKRLKSKIIREQPSLRDQKEIKCLISIGLGHVSLYHRFRKEAAPIQREFSSLPIIYNIEPETMREKQFFPKRDMDNKKLAQSLIGKLILKAVIEGENTENEIEAMKATRYLASKFDGKDAEKLSKMLGDDYSKIINTLAFAAPWESKWQKTLEPFLEKFGLKLPKTREEVEEIIKKAEKKK